MQPKMTVKPKSKRRRSKRTRIQKDGDMSIAGNPRFNYAAKNLYEMLGGREGVLDLLRSVPIPTDGSDDPFARLRSVMMNDDFHVVRKDGVPKLTFGMMLAQSNVSERDVYRLFLDRKRAETLVTLATAEPRLAGELVDRASQKYVLCRDCGGTKSITCEFEDDDGEVREMVKQCNACDERGRVLLDGDFKATELFFDISKLSQSKGTELNVNQNVDARQQTVKFEVGMPGSAPSPLSMIRSLERIEDRGPRPILPPANVESQTLPVREAEIVERTDR